MATPRALPACLAVLLMPLARPERSGGTARIAVATTGAVKIPTPIPTPARAGTRSG
jgi:hypothetical protein